MIEVTLTGEVANKSVDPYNWIKHDLEIGIDTFVVLENDEGETQNFRLEAQVRVDAYKFEFPMNKTFTVKVGIPDDVLPPGKWRIKP